MCQDYLANLGVQSFQTGAPREVLDAQVQRGFAFVEEKCMEELLTSRGKAIPEGDEEDNSWKTELTMACLAAINPDMTDTEAAACIARGFVEEHPDCYATLQVEEEQLKDVCNAGEAQKIAEFVAGLAKVKAKKDVVFSTRDRGLHKYFKKSPAPKLSAAHKRPPRWLPKSDESNTAAVSQWIEKHAPPSVKIECDDYNGRWRVISANLDWRSISWTKRGYKKAAFEVLSQAWAYHKDYTSVGPPYDVAALEAEWVEPAKG